MMNENARKTDSYANFVSKINAIARLQAMVVIYVTILMRLIDNMQ